jgi:hypothetical protein
VSAMQDAHDERRAGFEPSDWLGPASCAAAALGAIAFFSTTSVDLSFSYDTELRSFGFNFTSNMDWWFHIALVAWLVAGTVAGAVGIRRAARLRPLAWLGAVVNGLAGALLTTFLSMALYQGAFR